MVNFLFANERLAAKSKPNLRAAPASPRGPSLGLERAERPHVGFPPEPRLERPHRGPPRRSILPMLPVQTPWDGPTTDHRHHAQIDRAQLRESPRASRRGFRCHPAKLRGQPIDVAPITVGVSPLSQGVVD